jgi:hypothetical protein
MGAGVLNFDGEGKEEGPDLKNGATEPTEITEKTN